MPALQNYPYLLSTLIGAAIVVAVYLLVSKERRIMLIGGAALVPFSFCAILHETSYWNAGRLGGFSWGIEDALFTFSVGSLTAAIGARVLQLDLPVRIQWQSAAKKFILLCFSATILIIMLTLAGMDIMFATIIAQIAVTGLNVSLTGPTTVPVVRETTVAQFTATVSPTSASIRRYDWDYGDGTTDSTSSGTTTHVYSTTTAFPAGARVVTVRVTVVPLFGESYSTSIQLPIGG